MTGAKSSLFCFADIEAREREFSLIKAGEALPVEPVAERIQSSSASDILLPAGRPIARVRGERQKSRFSRR